ncbi:MAG: HipA N-terminal domain protein [Moraxellaceae bacterium]|jgi:serine/threonine-protein kinase HipA|nr:HipA N-terminal domain protein [Moraxellaceae bacterium]
MKLDVRVAGLKVASLFREGDEFVLLYEPGTAPEQLVSLTMPVRARPWTWPRDLPPFFRQNLPEGYLLGVLQEAFGRLLDGTDFSLLALVGGSGIGRVTLVPEGKTDTGPVTALDLAGVLHGDNTEAAFEALVRQHALQAVSGVFPKFLEPGARAPDWPAAALAEKTTLRSGRHLIKGSGARTPFLALNEHYTLEVLRRTGAMAVVDSTLSDDGRVLVVRRFDVDEQGEPMCAVEDLCGLLGRPPAEKYAPTTEQVISVARAYLAAATAQADLEQLGWLILASYVLRNADLHTKNIALRYTQAGDVRLAPAYDVVTTEAYAEFATNPPGLMIEGKRSWRAGKTLERLFKTRLGIAPRRYQEMRAILCEAATATGLQLLVLAAARPEWREVIGAMLWSWVRGIGEMGGTPEAAGPLTRALAEAGMAEPGKGPAKTVIGKSELMGKGRPF